MRLIEKLKKDGAKKTLQDIYVYQIDKYVLIFLKFILKKKPLKEIIMIESHNDFDCNGGAFYEYLINEGYNKNYKIVWLLKHPEKAPRQKPLNVDFVPLFKPSIKKDYYICRAKYFTSDNETILNKREGQVVFYLTHGAGGLKNVIGKINIPDSVDYILIQSEKYAPIQARQYSLEYPSDRLVYLGYPAHDVMLNADQKEIKKITKKEYSRIILWMPTFRKGGGEDRNDSRAEQSMGIPLIENEEQFEELNAFLHLNDVLLIVKIHPMQDLESLKIRTKSNIIVLTGDDVKKLDVDNYRLLPCVDAMISDYSGIAYEFLQLNKPIAYVFADAVDYKLGFVVDDVDQLIAGEKIYSIDDMEKFILDVIEGNDPYRERRKAIRDYIYKYNDNNNCKRLADFMGLKKEMKGNE